VNQRTRESIANRQARQEWLERSYSMGFPKDRPRTWSVAWDVAAVVLGSLGTGLVAWCVIRGFTSSSAF
jgi:hypothetical protein